MSNFMRVIGTEATIDPTKIEVEVKKLIAMNQKRHLQKNEERKLGKD
jgi:hypothetical protein